ncbi:unnamed protein product, partial [Allacma fusca]
MRISENIDDQWNFSARSEGHEMDDYISMEDDSFQFFSCKSKSYYF